MESIKWNNSWKFWPDGDAFALVWNVPAQAREVTLPHDAMIESPARADSPNRGNTGWRDGGNYTYVKTLSVSAEDAGTRYTLKFEGVYAHALVFVNEQYAGGCANGYSTFYVELTDLLHPGDNEVRVLVKNVGMTNSRWYSGSGIYRDVYLLRSGPVYIAPDGVQITTENADQALAVLSVKTTVVNSAQTPHRAALETRVGGAAETTALYLRGGETRTVSQRIVLTSPQLWSAEHPALYTLDSRLTEGDTVLDTASERFGVRTLELDAARGLRVNGEAVKLRGACIHHDSGLLGAATYADAEKRRIALLKDAGFNAIRMSHHPAAPALLDACDALGMYVMDEFTDMWNRPKSDLDYAMDFEKNWADDVERMVKKDFNHPSVVLYSVGNEIPEIGSGGGSGICAAISDKMRALDPTRFTTAGINGIFAAGGQMGEVMADLSGGKITSGAPEGNVNEFMAVITAQEDAVVTHRVVTEKLELACAALDVAGYNYMTARYAPDTQRYPNRVMVGSETYPPQIARNWALITKLPGVIGDFTWTGWDYIGEAGIGMPSYGGGAGGHGAYCGDLDLTGFRRPASYYREIVFGLRSDPYIAVQDPAHYGEQRAHNPWILTDAVASWGWTGYEGKGVVVEVYAPGGEVELFLNGASLGKQPVVDCKAEFETVYAPGTLSAVCCFGGAETGRFQLRTPGQERRLAVEEDYRGGELRYLSVALTDENGVVVTDADELLTAEVSGAALLGFGSGDPAPKHNYNEGRTDTWNGRALMVLKTQGDAPIRATVRSASGLSAQFKA